MVIKSVPAFEASDGSVHATKEGVIAREITLVLDAHMTNGAAEYLAPSFIAGVVMGNREELFKLLKELT